MIGLGSETGATEACRDVTHDGTTMTGDLLETEICLKDVMTGAAAVVDLSEVTVMNLQRSKGEKEAIVLLQRRRSLHLT